MPVERAIHYRFSVFDDQTVDEAMERLRRKMVDFERANKRVSQGQQDVNRRLRDARGRFIGAGEGARKLGDGIEQADDAARRGRRSFLEFEAAVSLLKTGWAALNKVAGAFKAPIDAAVTYERLFKRIQTLSDEVGAETEQALLSLAARVPQSVEDILTAGYQAISGGIDVNAVPRFLESASDLARTDGADLTTTVDLLTTALNSYKARGLDAADATDVLVRTVQGGRTDIAQLSASLGNVAAVAASAEIPFAELNAAIATHTKSGPGGTAEATRNIRALIDVIRNPPEKVAKTFDQIGFSYGIAALRAKGLRGVLVELEAAVEANNVDMGALIKNTQASAALTALSGTNAAEFAKNLDQITDSSGAAANGLAIASGSAQGLLDQLGATTDALMVELGQEALPVLKEGLTEIIGFVSDNKDVLIDAFRGAVEHLVAVGEWLGEYGDELLTFVAAFFATTQVHAFADAIGGDLMSALRALGGAGGLGGVLSAALRSPTTIGIAVGGAILLGQAIGDAIGEEMTEDIRDRIAELEREAAAAGARLRRALANRGFETPEQAQAAQAQVESGALIPRSGVTVTGAGGLLFDNDGATAEQLVAEQGDAALKTAEDVASALERASAILTERAAKDREALDAARAEYEAHLKTAADIRAAGPVGPAAGGRLVRAVDAAEATQGAILDLEIAIDQTEARSKALAEGAEATVANINAALQAHHNRPLEDGEGGTKTSRQVREEAKERARQQKAAAAAARRGRKQRDQEADREAKRLEREADRLARMQLQFDDDLADRRAALIRDDGARRLRELELVHERQLRAEEAAGEQRLRLVAMQADEKARLLDEIERDEAAARMRKAAAHRQPIEARANEGDVSAIDEITRLDQDKARDDALGALDGRAESGAYSQADIDRGRLMLRQAEADELAAIAATEGDVLAGIAGELQDRLTQAAEEGAARRIAAQTMEAAAIAGQVGAIADSAAGLLEAVGASERAVAAVKVGAMLAIAAEETMRGIAAGAAGNYAGAIQHGLAAGSAVVAAVEWGKVAGGGGSGASRPAAASGGGGGATSAGSRVDPARVSGRDSGGPMTQNINVNLGAQALADERSIEFAVVRAVKRASAAPGRPRGVMRKVVY